MLAQSSPIESVATHSGPQKVVAVYPAAHTVRQNKQTPYAQQEGEITLADVTFDDTEFTRAAKRGAKGLNHQIPLLLMGETGSGKEALARALHQESNRAGQSFVALNCAAIPEGLIESELFGYSEGAFTGARRGGMQGKVQQADRGTLFLDEIGDMPLDLQARLLRVLQDRCVTPLGSGKVIPVDITVVCATHRDLKQMVADGTFREDLYYRLNGVAIRIPPLRDRRNFPAFVGHMLRAEAGEGHGMTIAPELMACWQRYRWPGNVRQLQTVIKTCIAFMEEGECQITDDLLTEEFREELNLASLNESGGEQSTGSPNTLKSAEVELIKRALVDSGGNISAAAVALGISRATLYRRLQNAGISSGTG